MKVKADPSFLNKVQPYLFPVNFHLAFPLPRLIVGWSWYRREELTVESDC